jgi:peptide chain release factor 1
MVEKLERVANRYQELTRLMSDPEVVSNNESYRKYAKEHSDLGPIVACYEQLKKVGEELEQSKTLLDETADKDLREMAAEEVDSLRKQQEKLREEMLILLLPKDPNDEKNVIIEIRAGTGGDEAALFCEDLFGMYTRYLEGRRWKLEVLSISYGTSGGFKEIIARVEGHGAYSDFKYESGVHRVQRVPDTETQGRIHTSTVTVAVLPEAEEIDLQINEKDLRIDVFRSSGPGGQSVNTTDSAVRVTHLPTNMVVVCQDEKSQHKNKAKALMVLRARLLDQIQREQDKERSENRRSQIGSGERSEKIRTYNFPQSRITDHRIGLTLYQLDTVLAGQMQHLIEPMRAHDRTEALRGDS